MTAGVLFISPSNASATDIEYTDGALKEYYALGETFVCPSAKLNVGGKLLDVKNSVLYYPDGKAVSDGTYVLSNQGKYVLRYFADDNGKTVYAEDTFTVKGELYSVSSNVSSASYGNSGENKGNIDGLQVTLASGDVFTYKKPLDLTDKKKTDKIISLFVLPENKGIADVQDVKVRLTDVVDETNFVEFVVFANSADENEADCQALAVAARSSVNNKYVALCYKGSSDYMKYDGDYYKIYKDVSFTSRWGYPSYAASLSARFGYGEDVVYEGFDTTDPAQAYKCNFDTPISYSMDYAERKVYGYSHGHESWWRNSNNELADFDDVLFFDNLWKGFTTGEAYLSIYSDMYVNSTFSFVILNIFDEDLTETDFEYGGSPTILVDNPEGELPYAIKGVPYSVFAAKAYSGLDGEINCTAMVYREYHSESPKACRVVGGAFVPDDANASYSIVYSAVDSCGNRTEKVVDIVVKETRTAALSLVGGDLDGLTGERITLKQPVCENANGSYTVSVTAELDGKVYPVESSDDGVYALYTLQAGNYVIGYAFTDHDGTISEEYNLSVGENPYSVFYGDPTLPCAFVKGAEYTFPTQYGKSFGGGKVNDLTATLKYAFDGGANVDYDGTPVLIAAENKVTLTYTLEGAETPLIIEKPVTDVTTAGKIDKAKYFYSVQFDTTATEDCARYSASAESAKLSYVKPVLTTDFALEFEFVKNNFSSASFTLRDTENSANAFKIVMANINAERFSVNVNGQNKEITGTFIGVSHKISYNSVLDEFKIDGFVFDVNGVNDFAKKTAYFDIEIDGIEGKFDMDIISVGNQKIDDGKIDLTSPLYYLDVNSGKKAIGDKIVIKGLYIADLLSFTQGGTITVKDPDGNICRTTDNVLMNGVSELDREYEIELTAYGTYVISYRCWDEDDNPTRGETRITTYGAGLPVVEISETDKHTAVYANKTYKIATATAKDSGGKDIAVIAMVIDTEGIANVVENGEFNFGRAGAYKVMYYAEDALGNVGFATYDITAVDR